MLVTLDLTSRQVARVLAQATQNAAELVIEPRTRPDGPPIKGRLTSVEVRLLTVELDEPDRDIELATLIGVFCDVQAVLSGQLYLFSTCVVDVADNAVPPRLVLAGPTEIQLVNRRKFERRLLAQPSSVHLATEGTDQPPLGELINISGNGLAVRVPRANLEDVLFVGDTIRVAFELPGRGGFYDLPAIVCSKTAQAGGEQMVVGLEFATDENPETLDAFQRLRRVVCSDVTSTTDPEGLT
jgi:hypothetical protein